MKIFLILVLITISLSLVIQNAFTDEGMWLFNSIPNEKLNSKYGIKLSQEWLDKVRLASVRFQSGGSGSFISANGLVLTNHHVAMSALSKLSSKNKNYVENGFYAEALKDEVPCLDEQIRVLISITDVTNKLLDVPGKNPQEQNDERKKRIAQIEKENMKNPNDQCEVVSFYSGKAYHLYKYKNYNDIRLVFSPEMGISFYGGDPMNFTYPRYCLDMAIFRVYENGKPMQTSNYLKFNKNGVKENDVVFVSGHPGNTQRLNTSSQMKYNRINYNKLLDLLRSLETTVLDYGKKDKECERQAKDMLFGIQNSRKAINGYAKALDNQTFWKQKEKEESELKNYIKSKKDYPADYSKAFDDIDNALKKIEKYQDIFSAVRYLGFSKAYSFGMVLVQYCGDRDKPNGDRLETFQDANIDNVKRKIIAPVPLFPELEKSLLKTIFKYGSSIIKNETELSNIIALNNIDSTIEKMMKETKVFDSQFRKTFWEADKKSQLEMIEKDILLKTISIFDKVYRKYDKLFRDDYQSIKRSAGAVISKAFFDWKGGEQYPDATFTLRLSYGVVKGYKEGNNDIPYTTNLEGLSKLSKSKNNTFPYNLPERWSNAIQNKTIPLSTNVDFVATPDIIGGNSGSPVIDLDGSLVGLIFDGNIQSLCSDFYYEDIVSRAVSVHSNFILASLKEIYKCDRLIKEIELK